MSELPIIDQQPSPPAEEEPILVGFRVDPGHEGPQFYSVFAIGGDNERPLIARERLLFFTRPELAPKALLLDESMAHLELPLEGVEMLCDVAQTLHLVNAADEDPDGMILDCLHLFDDMVRATKLNMPERYQSVLSEMTDHLSKGASLKMIFTSSSLRNHVEDALLWCVGAITVKATMLTE
jgi:hypothetical protein